MSSTSLGRAARAVAVLVAVALASSPQRASACTCERGVTDAEAFAAADEVFEARAGSTRTTRRRSGTHELEVTTVELAVTRVWKGALPAVVEAEVDTLTSCAVEPPREGSLAIFYGRALHYCARWYEAESEEYLAQVAQLGPGAVRSTEAGPRSTSRTAGCAHCAAAAPAGDDPTWVVALVLGCLLLTRRRTRPIAVGLFLLIPTAVAPAQQRLALGRAHTCVVHEGRVLHFADGDHAAPSSASVVDVLDDVVEVGAGLFHSCARTADGGVYCWGANAHGQAGSRSGMRPFGAVPTPTRVPVRGARQLSVGGMHACVLLEGGEVWCWGGNRFGELGDAEGGPAPVRLPVEDAQQIVTGPGSTCAVSSSGAVRCFGRVSTRVVAPRALSLGWSGACAIDAASVLRCDPEGYSRGVEQVDVGALRDVVVGLHHVCVAGERGLACAGPRYGVLPPRRSPRDVDEVIDMLTTTSGEGAVRVRPSVAAEVRLGDVHACVREGRELWCWGYLAEGRAGLGLAMETVEGPPARELGGAPSWHACQLHADGTVFCREQGRWHVVERLVGAVDVAVSRRLGCAIDGNGDVWCWGPGGPALRVAGVAGARVLSVGLAHACTIDDAGAVLCWGTNEVGQSGGEEGLFNQSAAPVALPSRAVSLRLGRRSTCATLEDGREVCWGGSPEPREESPCAIVGSLVRCGPALVPVAGAVEVIADERSVCVRDADGVVRCGEHRNYLSDGHVWPPRRVPLEVWGARR